MLAASEWYWLSYDDDATVRGRDFAEGGTILVTLESGASTAGRAVTIHWPWQNVLAGETQFAQLMRSIFGNLSEVGFGVPPVDPVLDVGEPQPPPPQLPCSLRLPASQPVQSAINVVLGRTFFCAEAPHSEAEGDLEGCGALLVHMHLANSRVQHRSTAGALLLPLHPSAPNRVSSELGRVRVGDWRCRGLPEHCRDK